MKTKTPASSRLLLVGTLALAFSAAAFAQTTGNTTTVSSAASQTTPPAPSQHHDKRGPNPLGPLAIFDTNHDGVISADEINNAPAVLRSLEKSGKDEITPADVRAAFPRPPRPQGDHDGHHGDHQGPPNGSSQDDHSGPPPSGDDGTPPPPPPSDQN